jgi:hypothetical protein
MKIKTTIFKLNSLCKLGLLALAIMASLNVSAQTTSASNYLVAQPIPDRTVSFGVSDAGVPKPITFGLDLAWLSEGNVRRGVAFMGADRVGLVRSSFTPTSALVNGDLATAELATLNQRIGIINTWLGANTKVVLNCDHPSVDASFKGNAANWATLIDVTTRRHQEAGRTVVTVSPFNEPDNTAVGQGTVTDFYNICSVLKTNSRFNTIRICGGNTLNDDQALSWYNTLKAKLDEGNTHQLAGSFDNYATFYQTVRINSDYATNDELHNVMEAMVGVEYGLQAGIWWGTAEYARGEFVKASDGQRLGYAEHRANWTAASVYRTLEGKVQAFAGMSERQSATTTYRYVSKDRDVFYDGNGPQREYTLVMPGGAVGSYQNGQTNGERVVNITWGEDIQPVISGKYILVNRNSGKVLQAAGGSAVAGTNLVQSTNTGATYQQWNVTPVDSRIGGDFSYFSFINVNSSKSFDLLNWSLDNGGNIIQYDDVKGGNQQWYLDYAGDGWFYIRSRQSAKCVDVYNSGTADGATICQWDKNAGTSQQWRFIPIDATVEFVAPSAPTNLVATANAESVKLTWTASSEADVAGYTIFRSSTAGGTYTTIARNITSTSFVDNTATLTGTYYYKIKAVDKSLNRSAYTNEVAATTTGANGPITQLLFDGNTLDNSINLNHGASSGTTSFVTGKVGTQALALNGTNAFVQLPATLANQQNITIATWVYWNGGNSWQRIFDFGNDQTQYMFLTPKSGAGVLRFVINNGAGEQGLDAPALTSGVWSHVAVTMGTSGVTMYVNGVQVATTTAITIRPLDFKPILNYIGRSQFADPLFNGNIDDFRVYNYALSASEITQLLGTSQTITFNDFSPIFVGDADSAIPASASSGLALTYTSSNTAVATIVSGKIHVVGYGTSTITATQAGNATYLPATATKTLTVYPIAPGTYKLTCRKSGKCLDNLGATANTSGVAQYTSGSSLNQQWVISLVSGYYKLQCVTGGLYLDSNGNTADGSAVTENILWNGAVTQDWTILPIGSYYKLVNRANGKCVDNAGITTDGAYMKFYGSGSSYNQQWTMTQLSRTLVKRQPNVNQDQNENQQLEIEIYPNPVQSQLIITSTGSKYIQMDLYNILGKLVKSGTFAGDNTSINLDALAPGIYVVRVNNGQKSITKNIIKK